MATKTAPKKKVITRRGGLTKTTLRQWFSGWTAADKTAKQANARKTELRDQIMAAIEKSGYSDDKGHQYLDLGDEVEGYSRLQRQRRVSQSVDTDKVVALVKRKRVKGVLKTAVTVSIGDAKVTDELLNRLEDLGLEVETREVVDEDALAAAVFEGKISQAEFDETVERRETFAFVPIK